MSAMPSRDSIRKAQAAAKLYLEMRGYEIIEQNWHQSRYKIDIVAQKDQLLYFVDVRYLSGDNPASGPETITATKIKQLRQAAISWTTEYKWQGEV